MKQTDDRQGIYCAAAFCASASPLLSSDLETTEETPAFCGRRLVGDAVDAVGQENRVIVHRRQAASHGPVFAARQRYVEDVVAPPTHHVSPADYRLPITGEIS
ncbi:MULTISPECIES: hypothetical protein [Pseudomonas syringae group]|uniref:hypothetical protein n=1 Tax=Pseudomonas syringae group TaxID=136849 RepID=UPI0012D74275|nr:MULTISPECIES: hypothetical protein [Pseudomonas syringae group]